MSAIKHQFQLGRENKKNESSITYRFKLKGTQFKFGTGKSINPKLWNFEDQRPTADKKIISLFLKDNPTIKTELDNTRQRIENIISLTDKFFGAKELQNEIIDFEELKTYLNEHFTPEKAIIKTNKTDSTFSDIPLITRVTDHFIKEIQSGKKTIIEKNKSRLYDQKSIKAYINFYNFFLNFENFTGQKFTLLDIDPNFEQKLHNYFDFLEYEPGSKGNKIKALKSIINDFIDSNYIRVCDNEENPIYKGITSKQLDRIRFVTSKLKKPTGTTTKVILTEKEINTLFEIDLAHNKTFEKARDIFLIGCYTGLRHSDYNSIKEENIKNDWLTIIVRKGKTGKTVKIPIRPELQFLFQKYDYKIPAMSSQKLGQYMKDVCQFAGIDEKIEVISNAGGKETRSWIPKHQLISSHTARRSGLTLMYDNGIKLSDLLLISGHTTEKQLKTYIFINEKDWQNRVINSDFVKKSRLKVI